MIPNQLDEFPSVVVLFTQVSREHTDRAAEVSFEMVPMQPIGYVLEAAIQAFNVGCPPNEINELIFGDFDPMDLLSLNKHSIKEEFVTS